MFSSREKSIPTQLRLSRDEHALIENTYFLPTNLNNKRSPDKDGCLDALRKQKGSQRGKRTP